ncbi:MAG: translation initiation factor IF-2 [Bacteroidetes bacterium]|nr:translation initiation factor IF-2 [Bacteroidota bacterium]
MSEAVIHRLSKVAKELNISTGTIVDFLKSKGHAIESNPNAKLTADQYDLLSDGFLSEKKDKEESKRIQELKEKKKTLPVEEIIPERTSRRREDNELVIRNMGEENVIRTPKETTQFNIKEVGKIDLDSFSKKKKEEPSKEKEKEQEKPAERAKKEERIPVPEPEKYKTTFSKLEGPTVVGKIELPVEKESDMHQGFGKKKKKRIKKQKVQTTEYARFASDATKSTEAKPLQHQQHQQQRRRGGGGRGRTSAPRPELTQGEIQSQIKQTLSKIGGTGKSRAAKYRKLKRDAFSEKMDQQAQQDEAEKQILKVTEFISVSQLASMMELQPTDIISFCMGLGIFVSINQRLDAETISLIAEEFGYQVQFISVEALEDIQEEVDAPEDLLPRPPIVTVMGHVDHGKTSLLDYIRKANVIAGEAGGITQHIGAYGVILDNGKKITFLDTPGHEAFTAMRARGAQVTDVAIIVIAADDGIKPQTTEAINHAQAAGVPIVFAINKIDKPGANPEKVKEQLSQMNMLVEDWGGKYQCQEVAAKSGKNVELLLEKVLLEAEVKELKANPNKHAVGTVVESSLDKGRGYVATILVKAGTLHMGDVLIAGPFSGKIKALYNERGTPVDEAGPSAPVQILGLDGAPQAGDKFHAMDDERQAKEIANKRMQLQREQSLRTKKHITLDEIGRRIAIGDFQQLNIIVKGDVDGSVEALSGSLLKLSTPKIQVSIIHKGIGQITDSDVLLASASNAIIVCFNVRPSASARKLAEQEQIDIRFYSIIYNAINEVKDAMEGMLAPEFQEKITCNIEIREVFNITKVGTVAGCMMLDGKISRNTKIRVIRNGVVIHSGSLSSLKRFKDDVKEVVSGQECGLSIDNFNDIQTGDIIEGYEQVEVKAKL